MKNKLIFLFLVWASFSLNQLQAQDFNFRIVHAFSHQNLDSVIIYLKNVQRKYQTDQFGSLVLQGNIAIGDSIKVFRRGFYPREMVIPNSGDIFIRLTPLPLELRNVEIVAYTNESVIFESPQTIATLDASDFERNSAASIEPALNTIPGVLMESRGAGGSRRLSIRGSAMRSPFGVRNVKIYWNEFPLTLADGSSALELIDPEEIGRVEILKGPQGSIYGEGHGGAALFTSRWAPFGKTNATANFQGGSYGMQKQTLSFSTSSKKTAISVNYFRFRNEGYRMQEAVRKDQFNVVTRFRPAENREIKLFLIYYNGSWQLPGELDSLEMLNNPQMARPYAVENNTRVDRKWIRTGLSNKIYFTEHLYNFTAVFLHSGAKINPFGNTTFYNGYKDEGANGYGLRTIFGLNYDHDEAGLVVELGGEFQRDLNALAEFDLLNGEPGDLRTNDETVSRYFNGFIRARTHVKRKLVVDASLGILHTFYRRTDLIADPEDLSISQSFRPVWLPKLSMLYQMHAKYAIYSVISRGAATPTLWEIQASPDLIPEQSDHYELGVRGSLFGDHLLVTLNGYLTRINNAITEQPDSLGFSRFANGGRIDMRGVEISGRYQKILEPNRFISTINFTLSSGIQRYTYDNLVISGQDFSGNEVPGIPLLSYSLTADLHFYDKLSLHTNYRFFDSTPLNNANTVYSESYGILDLRINYRLPAGKKWTFDFYLGSENLQDTQYSSFFRLNAINGRYFNPQPGRTIYGGLRIGFTGNNNLIQ